MGGDEGGEKNVREMDVSDLGVFVVDAEIACRLVVVRCRELVLAGRQVFERKEER